ncbi:hypothetical protein BWQ96_06402 [Gracilariopsis chorda]|uniref:Uncharacterized protein n=1 Tax=Gracilariopsis chorda TaxID=448386 RepID=A0A2V3IP43_9FLOR|nr:hypothetical protein BWQ96_06402 [Gracilariopsis chorda]|eukprot:PXF43856.1 hypothetical protein BWQ96_06402 [Gracilariopsis chorda]
MVVQEDKNCHIFMFGLPKQQHPFPIAESRNVGMFNFETVTVTEMVSKKGNRTRYLHNMKTLDNVLRQDYRKWHLHHRSILDSQPLHKSTVKVLIFRGMAKNLGLGDRLRALARSYLTAVLTDRLFLIDLELYNSFSSVLSSPEGFNFGFDLRKLYISDTKNRNKMLPPQMKVVRNYTQNDLSVFLSETPVIVVDDYHGTDCRELCKAGTQMVSSKIKDAFNNMRKPFPKCAEIMPFVMNVVFRPTKKFRRYIKHIESHLGENSRAPYISIHARIGISFNETGSRFNLTEHRLTEKSLATCMARNVFLEAYLRNISVPFTFFISTDTPPFRKTLEQEIHKFDRKANVFFGSWEPFHIRNLKNKEPSDEEKLMNIFADIYFLSHGVFIFHIPSGFANLAKWFGSMTMEDSKVITLEEC